MAMKTTLIIITSVLTTLILVGSEASATMRSSVSLSVKEDYNDNIYLTETNEEDDYITKISPSFTLNFKNGRHDAALEYSYEWQDYANNSRADEGSHQGSAKITSVLVERLLTLNLSDVYEKTATDNRRSTNENEVLVNTVEKNTFTFNPEIHRNLSQVTTLSGGYEFVTTDYNNDTSEDVEYNNVYIDLERRFSKRLEGSVRYSQEDKETKDDMTEDFTSDNASISASLQVTPATSVDATFGRSSFDYETRSGSEENFWNASVKSKVTSSGTATLSYSREAEDSAEQGTHMSEVVAAKFSFGKRLKINLGGSLTTDEYLTSSREDDAVEGNASLSWQMTPKLNVSVNGDVSNEKFTLPSEEIDEWGAGLAANYRLGKHFNLSANFSHRDRDSTIVGNSYNNDVYTVSVLATY